MHKFNENNFGQLTLNGETVEMKAAFPHTHPEGYLSFQRDGGSEIFFVEDLKSLCEKDQNLLLTHLKQQNFVFHINEVISVDEKFEFREWKVRYNGVDRVFHTKLKSWPRKNQDGTHMIRSLSGDIYQWSAWNDLNPRSQKALEGLIESEI